MNIKNFAFFILLMTSSSTFASAKQTTDSFDRLLNVAIQHEMAVTNSQSEDSYFELKEDILTQINELGVQDGLILPMEELVAQQLVADMAQTIKDIEELKKEYPPILLAENTHDDEMEKYQSDVKTCYNCYKDAVEDSLTHGAIGAVSGATAAALGGPHTTVTGAILYGGGAAATSFIASTTKCATSTACNSKKPKEKEAELFKKKKDKEKQKPANKGKLTLLKKTDS